MAGWEVLTIGAGTGWKEISVAAGSGWKELLFDSVALDAGAACSDRSSAQAYGTTLISMENPANASGTLTSVCIWSAGSIGGFKLGMFELVSGNTYKCKSAVTIGNVAEGENNAIGISLACVAGEYLGYYFSSGSLEADTTGAGWRYISGDKVVVDNESTYSVSGYNGSVYAIG